MNSLNFTEQRTDLKMKKIEEEKKKQNEINQDKEHTDTNINEEKDNEFDEEFHLDERDEL